MSLPEIITGARRPYARAVFGPVRSLLGGRASPAAFLTFVGIVLPPREGGGSPNQCFGHSRTRTNANTGTPAQTPLLRLPRQATTAELRVVDVIAQHDPEANPELPRRRDVGLRESFLRHLPSIEAL